MKKSVVVTVISITLAVILLFAACGQNGKTDATGENAQKAAVTGTVATDGFESITNTKEACKYRQELTSTGDVITTVSRNPAAIGYASLASVKDSVKALSVNGIVPSEATVKDGTYSIQRPFVLVTRTGEALSPAARGWGSRLSSTPCNI